MIELKTTDAILTMLQALKNEEARKTWLRIFLRGQPEADRQALQDFYDQAVPVVDGERKTA